MRPDPLDGLATRRVIGVEALVRWQRPGLPLVSPADIIPLAEESGLIIEMGAWVLQRALADAGTCSPGGTPPYVSVNLSARQFSDPDLTAMARRALEDSGLPPRRLCLEITESVAMGEAAAVLCRMEELRALGLRLAIDDFGTGFSSLSYLKRFPVDVIKIDRAFVDGVGEDAESRAIVGAVLSMARALNLAVVAEGVERAADVEVLRELGCSLAQGFLFSRPLPVEELPGAIDFGPGG